MAMTIAGPARSAQTGKATCAQWRGLAEWCRRWLGINRRRWMCCKGATGTRVSEPFDWYAFRETLTGGARQLALECELVSLSGAWLRLRMPIEHKPLLVFADSFRDQVGIEKRELRITIEMRNICDD